MLARIRIIIKNKKTRSFSRFKVSYHASRRHESKFPKVTKKIFAITSICKNRIIKNHGCYQMLSTAKGYRSCAILRTNLYFRANVCCSIYSPTHLHIKILKCSSSCCSVVSVKIQHVTNCFIKITSAITLDNPIVNHIGFKTNIAQEQAYICSVCCIVLQIMTQCVCKLALINKSIIVVIGARIDC